MNTPNKITVLRICLIPLVVFFYLATFIPWNAFIAGVLFVIAALTDLVDGYLARKNNEVTDLGKFLDQIADKMLMSAALICIVAYPIVATAGTNVSIIRLPWLGIVFAVLILAREFAVSALRMVAASKGKVLPAEKSGKVKTVLQFVTLTLYFFYTFYVVQFYAQTPAHKTANAVVGIVLLVLFGLATLWTIISGFQYFARNAEVFSDKEERVSAVTVSDQTPALVKKEMPKSNAQKAAAAKTAQKTTQKAETKPAKSSKPAKPAAKKSKTQAKKKPAPKFTHVDKRGRPFDDLIPTALDMFLDKGYASTTMLQKHLGVGYPRASKIVDQMEELGIISAGDGIKPRDILKDKQQAEQILNENK